MAGSPKGESPRNGNGKERDNLTRIEGIGETKAQWLQSIGIATLQDLACASADYLESRLKAEGHATGRNEIEKKWIAQAQKMVDEASSQQTTESLEVDAKVSLNSLPKASESSQPPEATSEAEADAEITVPEVSVTASLAEPISEPKTDIKTLVSHSPASGEWSTFASFAVEFQDRQIENRTEKRTLVRHVETDTVESWSSIEGEHFKRWILGQVSQTRPSEPLRQQPTAATPAMIKIRQLHLLQPPETRMPVLIAQAGRIVSNSIRSNELFSFEVTFELIGDALTDIAGRQAAYCVQWDAKNLAPPHEIISLGDTEPKLVVAGQTSYTTRLPAVILHSGIYRLQILVILRGVVALPTFFDALVLQVI